MAIENSVESWMLAILPQMRRIARALTGDNTSADAILSQMMREFNAERQLLNADTSHQLLLLMLRSFVTAWLAQPVTRTQILAGSEDLIQLDAFLQRLPRPVRCVYVLIELEALSPDEVAEIMQIGQATVAVLLAQVKLF